MLDEIFIKRENQYRTYPRRSLMLKGNGRILRTADVIGEQIINNTSAFLEIGHVDALSR